MAKQKFDLQQEYSQSEGQQADMYAQAAGGAETEQEQQAQPEMVSLSIPADQVAQMKALISEQKFDEVGRIVSSLIS